MEHVPARAPARARASASSASTVDDASRDQAYVIVREGDAGDDALADELRAWCKERCGATSSRRLDFVDDFPRTLTGKVQRFMLRARS